MAPRSLSALEASYDRLQTVMGTSTLVEILAKSKSKLFSNTLIFPFYFAVFSAVVFLIQLILSTGKIQALYRYITEKGSIATEAEDVDRTVHPTSGVLADFKQHVAQNGGTTIFTFRIARLLGCLALLGLAVGTLVIDIEDDDAVSVSGKWGKKHKKNSHKFWLSKREWIAAALCMTYLYASLLAIISVSASRRWARTAIRHLNLVLVATTAIYIYRDVLPLATFTRKPKDIKEVNVTTCKRSCPAERVDEPNNGAREPRPGRSIGGDRE